MASLMPNSLGWGEESPISWVPFVLSLWRVRSMGLRYWVGQDLPPRTEDRYGGVGGGRGHALHQSLHLHPAASQLPVLLGGAESTQSKPSPGPLWGFHPKTRPPLPCESNSLAKTLPHTHIHVLHPKVKEGGPIAVSPW